MHCLAHGLRNCSNGFEDQGVADDRAINYSWRVDKGRTVHMTPDRKDLATTPTWKDCRQVKELGIVCLRNKGSKIWTTFSPFTPLNQDSREKIQRKLTPEVQSFPLDERNLIISKKGEGKELLVSLEKILQRLKDVLYSE